MSATNEQTALTRQVILQITQAQQTKDEWFSVQSSEVSLESRTLVKMENYSYTNALVASKKETTGKNRSRRNNKERKQSIQK